jgi:hypothetical protein
MKGIVSTGTKDVTLPGAFDGAITHVWTDANHRYTGDPESWRFVEDLVP